MSETPALSLKERLENARKKYEEIKSRRSTPLSLHTSSIAPGSDESTSVVSEQLRTENEDLKSQIKELNSTVEQQKATIKKLRNEATELKLDRMDLEERIGELEEEVKSLQPQQKAQGFKDTSIQLLELKPKAVVDFKDQIMKWKDWQVDMRTWNTATRAEV
ncbi:hypothetical protein PUMCH_003370 [Australozyma saopauloensis]|uniref:Autophagy-related protein 16 domain-containing protein n=1 Tax=Australozyma saopauloensis TaxID=291208 RepID=A0AAX4HE83_9ASCO|nr:hypothetical protein PUMCH_003370 [[Candida] saopauloensis]